MKVIRDLISSALLGVAVFFLVVASLSGYFWLSMTEGRSECSNPLVGETSPASCATIATMSTYFEVGFIVFIVVATLCMIGTVRINHA